MVHMSCKNIGFRLSIVALFVVVTFMLGIQLFEEGGASAEDTIDCRYKGGYEGAYEDIAYDDEYIYATYRQGLRIFDVSNASNPENIGFIRILDSGQGVAVSGDYAYVADGSYGLIIVDISDKEKPTKAGEYDTGGAYGIAVSGNYAYVAVWNNGLVVVDISNKTNPHFAGSYDTAGYAQGVAVGGDYAYVADGSSGLVVVDISNPEDSHYVGGYNTIGDALGVAISGDYAYVADDNYGLVIININDPTDPAKEGHYYAGGYAYDVAVNGDYAYVAADSNGLVIVDINDKENPTKAGEYGINGARTGVVVNEDFAYVVDFFNGLVIVDVSDKEKPAKAGEYNTAGWMRGVAVSGDYVYAASTSLSIVDISDDKTKPILKGHYDTLGRAYDVAVNGDYAYVADYYNGLVIVNTSDKGKPTKIGGYNTDGYAYGVAVSGNHAYVADGSNGLVVVNISNKENPTKTGGYNTDGYAYGVAVSGNYAYVADGSNGLVIVDISNEENPTKTGGYNTTGNVYDVTVSGNYVYVAADSNGLVIVDVDDKEKPVEIGYYDTAGDVYDVAVSGDYAYVADGSSGLVIVDISDKENLTEVGHYNTAVSAQAVAVSGNYVYVADSYNGLVIVELAPVAWINSTTPNPSLDTKNITFIGYGTSVNNITRYAWRSSIDGEFNNGTKAEFNHTDFSVGIHTIYLKVMDEYDVWSDEVSTTLDIRRGIMYIDDDAPDGGDGSMERPYSKIQYAIDNTSAGATIYVWGGTYYENVVVNKTLSLIGNRSEVTTIDGGGEGDVVRIEADWCNVSKFRVTRSGSLGYNAGIKALGDNCTLFDNLCLDNSNGILVSSSDNILANNTCSLSSCGILLLSSKQNIINSNNCSNNSGSGITIFEGSGFNTITNNTCLNNDKHGVYIYSTDNSVVFGNNCSSNNLSGINIEMSSSNTLYSNIFSFNFVGISNIFNSRHNTVYGNTIVNNRIGLWVAASSSDITLFSNLFSNNRDFGINATKNDGHTINATNNWWGHTTGPYHYANNTEGKGDNVTDYVDFGDWLAIMPGKSKPVATIQSISPDPALDLETVTFSGSVSADGDIEEYLWRSSEDGEIYRGTSPGFSASNLTNGTHTIFFSVCDQWGVWSDEVSDILIVNGKPVAYIDFITPDTALDVDEIYFKGHGTDDSSIERCAWRSSRDGEFYNGSSFERYESDLSNGTHTIFFKVRDDMGIWSDEVSTTLEINGKPRAIIESVSPSPALDIDTVHFSGNCDEDETIVRYVWRSSLDGEFYNNTALDFYFANLSNGTHTIFFKVLDNEGIWSDEVSISLKINGKARSIIESISPSPALDVDIVHFIGEYDEDDTIVRYAWRSSLDGEFYNDTNSDVHYDGLSNGTHTIYFKVLDNYGVWSDECSMALAINGKPRAIIESIAPSPALDGGSIYFVGGYDEDNTITRYAWHSILDGEFYNDTASDFYYDDLSNGTHTIYFKVLDNEGIWSAEVSTTLTINGKPRAIIESIFPTPALDIDMVHFVGDYDEDDTLGRYVWRSSLDGEFYNDTNSDFYYDNLSNGTHAISFKVQDNDGIWSAEVSTTLLVNGKPRAIIDSISHESAVEGDSIHFSGDFIEDDNIILCLWRSSLDGEFYNDTASDFYYTGLSNGSHTVYFKVQDNHGVWSTEVSGASITINGKPRAIIDSISPSPALDTDVVEFKGHGADDGSITAYDWRSSNDGQLSTENTFSKPDLTRGTHIIYFKVQDDESVWSNEISFELVIHRKPVAIIDSILPDPAIVGETVYFSGHGTDDGTILDYSWRSGKSSQLSNLSYFENSSLSLGVHTIYLQVKDNNGVWSDEVSTTVTIEGASADDRSSEGIAVTTYIFGAIALVVLFGAAFFFFSNSGKPGADEPIIPPLDGSSGRSAAFNPTLSPIPSPTVSGTSEFHYEILEPIGKGNFGEVVKAKDTKTGKIVAIKKPNIQGTIDETIYQNFMKEAKLWHELSFQDIEGIVKVHDFGVKPFPWIAMEYLSGGSLAEKVGKLDHKEASEIIIKLLETMNKVNRLAGVVHRDIKPENILLTSDGVPKIGDWGLGKHLLKRSISMGFKGTLIYSAPEQFDEKKFGKISWKTDMYQIGAVYYELLTGKEPFPCKEISDLIHKIMTEAPELPSKLNSSVPTALDAIVLKAMSKKQDARYEFMEMAKEIRKVVE